MQIYLARHGQSRWQVTREDGDWDSPLTTVGQEQARRFGEWAVSETGIHFGSIRSSTLLRAQQTAAPVAGALDRPVTPDPNLCEAEFLVSAHLPSSENPFSIPATHAHTPEYTSFKKQVNAAWEALVADAEKGAPVLAIAHGGFISTLLRHIVGSDSISFWIYNATLHELEWKRGRWHIVNLNRWDHLPPQLRTF